MVCGCEVPFIVCVCEAFFGGEFADGDADLDGEFADGEFADGEFDDLFPKWELLLLRCVQGAVLSPIIFADPEFFPLFVCAFGSFKCS